MSPSDSTQPIEVGNEPLATEINSHQFAKNSNGRSLNSGTMSRVVKAPLSEL